MSKNLYIDASHPNETRVVLKSNENIEDYEFENLNNTLIKNNIYLGKVSRIEPSLLILEKKDMAFFPLTIFKAITISCPKVI
jgi:hypothetical protein